jgi:predicted phage baseplate assembly protein
VTLPAPRLDDRTFQDLVDESKRRIHRLCPEWTDHNVSDPGVALIELFAWMSETVLYRMNQVPDRLYVKFLELVGIELFGSAAAETEVLFTLTAPQPAPVPVPAGTEVSTEQLGDQEPIVFRTDVALTVAPPVLVSCVTRSDEQYEEHFDDLRRSAARVVCFRALTPGDAFYLGFAGSLASNLVRLHVVTGVEGAGVRPDAAPLAWETWSGESWEPARTLSDTTDALNSPEGGDVTLLLPPRHAAVPIGRTRAFWLRCKLVEPQPTMPTYRRSPELVSLEAVSLGGAVLAHHAQAAPGELLGTSTGEPGQAFTVRRTPVLPRTEGETVRVVVPPPGGGLQERETQLWREVEHFGFAGPADRVFTWSSSTGEIRFGPALQERDGRQVQHGAVPPVDAQVFVTGYRHGGGRTGNVGARRLTVLRTSIPFVATVTNLSAASGGVDPESIENAKIRGPLTLRSGDRAVTAEDFERLTLQATPAVGRALCLSPEPGEPVRVLVVPRVDAPAAGLTLEHLALAPELVEAVSTYLDRRRLLTTRVQIDEPYYQGLMVVAEVRAVAGIRPESIREKAVEALYAFINPVSGGLEKTGWQFGRSLNDGDVNALLRSVPGVATVGRVFFFLADLRTGEVRDQQLQRVALPPDALLMSFQHQVQVEP